MKNSEDYYSFGDVKKHISSFIRFLKSKSWVLIVVFILGIAGGIIFYKFQKPSYKAITTFILEEKSSGGGGLAGIASQFGFDIGSLSGSGSIFTGDNILDILKSKKINYYVLLSKVEEEDKNITGQTLADLFLDFSGWKKKYKKYKDLENIDFKNITHPHELSQKQDSVLKEIHEFVLKNELSVERLSKKGSIIRVQVVAPDRVFARLMTERLIDVAAKLYLDIKTGTAQTNIAKLQRRSDSLLMLLNQKSYTVAYSQPLDINPGIRSASVPLEIATRDKTVIASLYSEVTKNLEASKLILSQQMPVIQILDRPEHLLEDNRKGLFFLIIITPFAFVFAYIICAFLFFVFRKEKIITE